MSIYSLLDAKNINKMVKGAILLLCAGAPFFIPVILVNFPSFYYAIVPFFWPLLVITAICFISSGGFVAMGLICMWLNMKIVVNDARQ